MQAQKFQTTFNIKPEMDLADVGSIMLKHVKQLMQEAQDNPSEDLIAQHNAQITDLYRGFFAYAKLWAAEEKKLYTGTPSHPEARRLKEKAQDAFTGAENMMIEYNITFMELMRSIGFIAHELKKYAQPIIGAKIKWNSADEATIHKYYQEVCAMRSRQEYLANAIPFLKPIQQNFIKLEMIVAKEEGPKKVEQALRSLRSALRTSDFAMARKKITNMKPSYQEFASAIVDEVEKNAAHITGADKRLYLGISEAENASRIYDTDIVKKEAFIAKYCQPYIENQIRRVNHLREKMLIIGSIDGLLTLYIRLIRGVAQPLEDMKAVREYEGQVLENIMYLITGQFREIATIHSRNDDLMRDFKFSLEAFESGIFDKAGEETSAQKEVAV